ncbi:MAG: mannose-6-phosphate isomerase, class I [Tumebacillaceae bacterium]
MVQGPLSLAPVFQERIWGGTALRECFGYAIPTDHTGECWGISAHPHGPSRICNGPLAGRTLAEVWEQHPELFGRETADGAFPLLVKILDANSDLSVQVHPDDAYAAEHERGELGKTECWYVLDCAPDAELILGHRAQSRAELAEMMQSGAWDDLLIRRPIQPGQFFYVPSGTVHALGKGTLVLEIQQSSDTTYRVYDYDRVDANGKQRELHVENALDVITVPHQDATVSQHVISEGAGHRLSCLVEAEYFAAYHLTVQAGGEYHGTQEGEYLLASVIRGEGAFVTAESEWRLKSGDHLIIPATVKQFTVRGDVEMMLARER